MESFVTISSIKFIELSRMFIEKRDMNKDKTKRSSEHAKRLQKMCLLSGSINLSMSDFCYISEEIDILKEFEL